MPLPLSYLELSRDNLRHNVAEFRKLVSSGTKCIAVVKANAYGHGLAEVVRCIDDIVDGFQVDDIEELRAVRSLTTKPIYIFGYVPDVALPEVVAEGAVLGVYSVRQLEILNTEAKRQGKTAVVHLKLDAKLGRQGVLSNEVEAISQALKTLPNINLEAVYSHFSDIEDGETLDHARVQYDELMTAKAKLVAGGFPDITHHVSATSGILSNHSGGWDGEFVRLGIGLYGLWPSVGLEKTYGERVAIRPVLRWVSHVAQVKQLPAGFPIGYGRTFITTKPTTIAIVPQGYSDGYDRGLSNKGVVLVRGVRCSVLGRVMMNMIVVDVSGVPGIVPEDEVVLLGKQGEGEISADELAVLAETISYEIVARLSPLVPRIVI